MKAFLFGVGAFGVLCLAASFIGPQAQAVSSSSQNFMEFKQANKEFATINLDAITYIHPQGNGTRICFLNGSYLEFPESYVKISGKITNQRLR